MKHLLIMALALSVSGCQFYRQVIVNEEGRVFPWRGHDNDPAARQKWDKDLATWKLEDAERRFIAGEIDRYEYDAIRKRYESDAHKDN